MEKIVKDFLENQNLKKDEFVKLIRAYKDPEAVEALKTRAVGFGRNITEIRYLPEGSLNLPITVKMTAITVESVRVTEMRTATG